MISGCIRLTILVSLLVMFEAEPDTNLNHCIKSCTIF